MVDIFGNDTVIGQKVVIIEPHYHNFTLGEVIKITPKGVRVKYLGGWGSKKETDTVAHCWINSDVDELVK